METIGVVGANCRGIDSEWLARLCVPRSERAQHLPRLAEEIGVRELVYLATCNRVEVAFRGDGATPLREYRRRVFGALVGRPPRPGEAERTLHAWAGEGAAEHLFLVASGLDSTQAGEHEIRTQVREALTMAREAGVSGTFLDFVVTRALSVALEVHRKVPLPGLRSSLADIAVELLGDRLHRTPGRVALIGVSPMTRHCGVALAERAHSVVVVNRTPAVAASFARELGGEHRSLAEFRSRPEAVEAVLIATGSPEILLGRPELEKLAARAESGEPPLVVDMSVPPNTDRGAAEATGTALVDMDGILAAAGVDRDQRLVDLAPAREIIDESLVQLRKELAARLMSPIIARLNNRYRETAVEGVKRLFGKELRGFGEAEREAVYRWAEVIARRFAHIPIKGLREIAAEFGAPAVKRFLDAAGEDLFPEDALIFDRLEDPGEMEI
jgi:glutamyl-tRNA reductase